MQTQHKIKIVDSRRDLEKYLSSVKNTRIDIAVAFASKTESLVEKMLKNGNRVNLILGTINYFSDPVFIRHCQSIAQKKRSRLNFAVDFRGHESIHWKVYLIAPDTVIIGSPNLTTTGITMERDTAVAISDKRLYKTYLSLFTKLERDPQIVDCNERRFENLFSNYEEQRRRFPLRVTGNRSGKRRSVSAPSFANWLKQDTAQTLPIFIWDSNLTPQEKKVFKTKIAPQITSRLEDSVDVRIVGCYQGHKQEQDYNNGDAILMLKSNGKHVHFEVADFVVFGAGNWWLCGIKRKRFSRPFVITQKLAKAIAKNAAKWFEDDRPYLDSKDLRKLV